MDFSGDCLDRVICFEEYGVSFDTGENTRDYFGGEGFGPWDAARITLAAPMMSSGSSLPLQLMVISGLSPNLSGYFHVPSGKRLHSELENHYFGKSPFPMFHFP